MKKKCIAIGILLVFLIVDLSGCTESTEKEKIEAVTAPFNILGLSLDDLPIDFVKSVEIYNTTPHYVDKGLLKDTYVLEMYDVRFNESEQNIIDQLIVRYETKERCTSVLNRIKPESSAGLIDMSGNIIGDDSYLMEETENISGIEYTAFVLVFRIADVLVVLSGVTPFDLDFQAYGHTIESNIKAYVE